MIRVQLIKTESHRCAGCGAWLRGPVGFLDDWKGNVCVRCPSTSTTSGHDGRPIGPKSRHWRQLCEALGINPDTGECKFYGAHEAWLLDEWFVWEADQESPAEREEEDQ